MRDSFKKGVKVKLNNPIDIDIWNVSHNVGTVLEVRGYGPNELMVTAQFGRDRVHIAHTHLEVIDE